MRIFSLEKVMTDAVVSYDTGGWGVKCPLCRERPVRKKTYGHDICKKCHYAFANRRQLGYLVDAVVMTVINMALGIGLGAVLGVAGVTGLAVTLATYALMAVMTCVFMCKDGFGGYSLGKLITGVQVVDQETGKPAGFWQSFKRHWFFLFGVLPFVGVVVLWVFIIVVAVQDARGYRVGDGLGKTRVIWKKYAHLPMFGGNAAVCEGCGYDLYGNESGTCPECGQAVSERVRGLLGVVKC